MTATTGREPEARRGALVIGYGNTLRSDDGAGPFVARALEARVPAGTRILDAHQLTPEMAIDISVATRVVFVDAIDVTRGLARRESAPQESGPRVSRLEPEPGADPLNPHASDPGSLLWLAKTLFGGAPEAWLVAIPGTEFGFGETLSPGTARASADAIAQVEALLART
ncbi:MAG: hydrogenase maturation protease [Thermoflexales bacterium]|nr:hydrogenase maturation protease [Thermoflexales bacterium]